MTQKLRGEVALAAEARRTSYAAKPGLSRPWSWLVVPMMRKRLRTSHEEHEVRAGIIKNLDDIVIWNVARKEQTRQKDREMGGRRDRECRLRGSSAISSPGISHTHRFAWHWWGRCLEAIVGGEAVVPAAPSATPAVRGLLRLLRR